jgi:hypothetical protein
MSQSQLRAGVEGKKSLDSAPITKGSSGTHSVHVTFEAADQTATLTRCSPAKPTLITLPVEILEEVFRSLDSFDTALELASCCKHFRDVYRNSKANICLGILRYGPILRGTTMSFYEKALRLFEGQQKAALGEQGKLKVNSPRSGGAAVHDVDVM